MIDFFNMFVDPKNISIFIGKVVSVPADLESSRSIVVSTNINDSNPEESKCVSARLGRTLVSAYTAWKTPPEIAYKGSMEFTEFSIKNCNIVTNPSSPGWMAKPCKESGLVSGGLANLSSSNCSVKASDFTVKLTSDKESQLPWCTELERDEFIKPGDTVLLGAVNNSMEELFVIEVY